MLRSWQVRYFFGPGALASPLLLHGKFRWLFGLIGGFLVEASNVAETRENKRQVEETRVARERQRIQEHLAANVQTLEVLHPVVAGTYRSNVMRVEGDSLTMDFATRGYTRSELEMRWDAGQGTCGRAWQTGVACVAPTSLAPLPTVDDAHAPTRPWSMTTPQIQETAHRVSWVVSMPISIDDSGLHRIVGVFSVDVVVNDPGLIAAGVPDDPTAAQAAIEDMGESVTELLAKAGLEWTSPPADTA